MFDIAFSEVMIIAVVALIVIGPERLPRVARTLGHLFGRMQRYVNDVKADIQREVELDELRKLKQTVEESARSIETSVSQEFNAAKSEVQDLEKLVQAQELTPVADASASAQGATAEAVPAADLPGAAPASVVAAHGSSEPSSIGASPSPAPQTKAG